MTVLLIIAAILFIVLGIWTIAYHGCFWGGLVFGGFNAIATGVEFLAEALGSIFSE